MRIAPPAVIPLVYSIVRVTADVPAAHQVGGLRWLGDQHSAGSTARTLRLLRHALARTAERASLQHSAWYDTASASHTYRVGRKNSATLIFLKQLSEKLTDFSNFWYTESRRNVTSDDYKFIHRTCKV